jgi:hypothetical protein
VKNSDIFIIIRGKNLHKKKKKQNSESIQVKNQLQTDSSARLAMEKTKLIQKKCTNN